jgi:hypothetical protein
MATEQERFKAAQRALRVENGELQRKLETLRAVTEDLLSEKTGTRTDWLVRTAHHQRTLERLLLTAQNYVQLPDCYHCIRCAQGVALGPALMLHLPDCPQGALGHAVFGEDWVWAQTLLAYAYAALDDDRVHTEWANAVDDASELVHRAVHVARRLNEQATQRRGPF